MAGSVNKVILIGNLGADPEIRKTRDGRPIAALSVATSQSWRDKTSGERREKTEWHRVVIFSEPLCRLAESHLKKGGKVYLEGELSTRKWEDNAGQARYATEVVLQGFNAALTMLDGKGGAGYRPGGDGPQDHGLDADRAAGPTAATGPGSSSGPSPGPQAGHGRNETAAAASDDIPF